MNHHFTAITLSITATMLLALVVLIFEPSLLHSENSVSSQGVKMSETQYFQFYEQLRAPEKTVVIYPIFTQSAYDWNGIHDYYMGRCDSCITTEIQNSYDNLYGSSGIGFRILEFLEYEIIDDIELDKNPEILSRYDKVILLHNEYVTKSEFEAISSHPKVIFLYPGALMAQIEADYTNNSITLVRGPNYPNQGITNGFDWKFDNSQYISNSECVNWEFYEIEGGVMLNCYPETLLQNNGYKLLEYIKNL